MVVVQHTVKFTIIVKIKVNVAKCCTKKKGINSLNRECSDNTAQDDSPITVKKCYWNYHCS